MTTVEYDALAALRSAGLAVDILSSAHREVLASLSSQEVGVLRDIKSRLDAVEPDVVGQEVKLL